MNKDIFKEIREVENFGSLEVENIVISGEKEMVVIYHHYFSSVLYQDGKWEEDVPQSIKDRVRRIIALGIEQYKEHEVEREALEMKEKRKEQEEIEKQKKEAFAYFLYATERFK